MLLSISQAADIPDIRHASASIIHVHPGLQQRNLLDIKAHVPSLTFHSDPGQKKAAFQGMFRTNFSSIPATHHCFVFMLCINLDVYNDDFGGFGAFYFV